MTEQNLQIIAKRAVNRYYGITDPTTDAPPTPPTLQPLTNSVREQVEKVTIRETTNHRPFVFDNEEPENRENWPQTDGFSLTVCWFCLLGLVVLYVGQEIWKGLFG